MAYRSLDAPVGTAYERLCRRLSWRRRRPRGSREHFRIEWREAQEDLELAGLDVGPGEVMSAARAVGTLAAVSLSCAAVAALLSLGTRSFLYLVPLLAAGPFIASTLVKSYPHRKAAARAAAIMKSSTDASSLMIMSLRLEASIPNAMMFASKRSNPFSEELRRAIWSVVMGSCQSFEDALHAMGSRWARYGAELGAALNAMVVSSREATEEGRRRALERANRLLVSGAKRRIEEYALALSTPSMIIFALGILLPLMVGSFLPMLSWDIWSGTGQDGPARLPGNDSTTFQLVFVMNIVFPALALSVASEAISRHPLELLPEKRVRPARPKVLLALGATSSAALAGLASFLLLDGMGRSLALLASAVLPLSAWLLWLGRAPPSSQPTGGAPAVEGVLFKTGARMVEGENFQSALNEVGSESGGEDALHARGISFRSSLIGQNVSDGIGGAGYADAIQVVAEAAQKDERQAGMLAMDLATYLRDLGELETTLKNRLRPTLSMMNLTARFLGPVVLGVTYAIYLSLAAVGAGGTGTISPGSFFLVLGAFLAETNAVTSYFVMGIEGKKGSARLARELGVSLLVSEAVYAATALVAT